MIKYHWGCFMAGQTRESLYAKLTAILDSGEREAISNAVRAINASYTFIRGHIQAEEQRKNRGLKLVTPPDHQKKNIIMLVHPLDDEIIR